MAKGERETHISKVVSCEAKTGRNGGKYMSCVLLCYGPDGTGSETQVEASVAPWDGWLMEPLAAMAGKEDGLTMELEEGDEKRGGGSFWNVVAIQGVEKPADWEASHAGTRPPAAAGKEGGKAAAPSPVQTRVAIVQCVGKLAEAGMVKGEEGWDAWYAKLDALVFNGKHIKAGK